MRQSRLALAVLLALVGLVWVGQGSGLIGGSVMTGSLFWAVVGLLLIVLAGVVLAWERRQSSRG